MTKSLTEEDIKYLISRLLVEASDAAKEGKANPKDSFLAGRQVAYYEMLDILQSELSIADADLKEFGLDINLEKEFA